MLQKEKLNKDPEKVLSISLANILGDCFAISWQQRIAADKDMIAQRNPVSHLSRNLLRFRTAKEGKPKKSMEYAAQLMMILL